jgi:hypothetical protein
MRGRGPEEKSSRSTRPTRSTRVAASSATPQLVAPPPMTSTSRGSPVVEIASAARCAAWDGVTPGWATRCRAASRDEVEAVGRRWKRTARPRRRPRGGEAERLGEAGDTLGLLRFEDEEGCRPWRRVGGGRRRGRGDQRRRRWRGWRQKAQTEDKEKFRVRTLPSCAWDLKSTVKKG